MADLEVARWLRGAGLSRFLPKFEAAGISSADFLELLLSDFDAFGVDSPADRKRLQDLVAERRRAACLPRRVSPPRPERVTEAARERERELRERKRDRERAREKAAAGIVNDRRKQVARVSVCVRKRPLSRKENFNCDKDVIEANSSNSLNVYELKEKVDLTKYVETHRFVFDRVFSDTCENEEVYEGTAKPLVEALFTGGRSTCFAYGQTGAGKTFTMAGDGMHIPGLYALAVHDLFERIEERRKDAESLRADRYEYSDYDEDEDDEEIENLQVWISFYEIYGTRLHDLLGNRKKLECREDVDNEVQIVGLVERKCDTAEEVMLAIDEASASRSTGVTGANDDSSRSHAVFQIQLREGSNGLEPSHSSVMRDAILTGKDMQDIRETAAKAKEIGRLCFIDLAGSERGSDTAKNNKQTRMEGAEINKSLLALKECIRAMGQRKDHTPFRGSKLTQVLKASFVGKNCRTVMIANVSPASSNVEHTLNTLRYSDRVKEIRKDRVGTNVHATFSSTRGLSQSGRALRVRRATLASGIGTYSSETQSEANLGSLMRSRKASQSSDETDEAAGTRRTSEKSVRTGSALPRGSSLSKTATRTTRITRGSSPTNPLPPRAELPPTAPSQPSTELSRPKLRNTRNSRFRATHSSAKLPNRRSLIPTSSKTARPEQTEMNGNASGSGSGSDTGARQKRSGIPRFSTRPPTRLRSRGSSNDETSTQSDEEALAHVSPTLTQKRRERPKSGGFLPEATLDIFQGGEEDGMQEDDLLFKGSSGLAPRGRTSKADKKAVAVVAAAVMSPVRTRGSRKREAQAVAAASTPTPEPHLQTPTTSAVTSEMSSSTNTTRTVVTDTSKRGLQTDAKSAQLRDVILHHHLQIEELMRLVDSDVQLVRAAESGEMDPVEYAMKLDLNLAQKLDMVITLKAKLGSLKPKKSTE